MVVGFVLKQLGGKDARLDQLQKELAVLAAAKEQLDHLVGYQELFVYHV